MTITPDQVKTLLDGGIAPGPYYVDEDWGDDILGNEQGHAMSFGPQLRMKIEGMEGGEPALFAAAPDLARTVIDQAEKIEKLMRMLDRTDAELHEYRNEFGDL